jgi:hypothetical protein
MEPCYQYLACKQEDCILYNKPLEKYCWEIQGTSCNHSGIKDFRELYGEDKKKACEKSGCIYFQEALRNKLVK